MDLPWYRVDEVNQYARKISNLAKMLLSFFHAICWSWFARNSECRPGDRVFELAIKNYLVQIEEEEAWSSNSLVSEMINFSAVVKNR